ncbi:winged helix-turn-helix domain-containing protein [Dyella flagellata]|uniref:Winged helix-turn helix domain-containing protein n=1 Tax=Dyella flagellata TaxID=1867833 RepID=A0ABQ5XF94_9GAMM|nr:hypothetical protein GCM10007898_33280 [Dyella flagellata]
MLDSGKVSTRPGSTSSPPRSRRETKRNLAAIEARRLAGARMLKRQVPQADVARALGVSRQAVSQWARQLALVDGAIGKLKAKAPGRPARLDVTQREWLSCALIAGALQAGFPTQQWNVKRVRMLIARRFAIEYTNSGCWELLRSLGFSPRKLTPPVTRSRPNAWRCRTIPGASPGNAPDHNA